MYYENPIYIDDTPITTLIAVEDRGRKVRYRQSIGTRTVEPGRDYVLDVKAMIVHIVFAITIDTTTEDLLNVVVVDNDGKYKKLRPNEVRILHDERLFDIRLN